MKGESLISHLKRVSKTKYFGIIAIGLAAGLILMIMPSSPDSESTEGITETVITSEEYTKSLEEKAEALIKELKGVDNCEVFITLKSGYRYVYATDQHVREQVDGKETDKTIVLANGENGETPLLIEETMPIVAGVAVVCKGASYDTQYKIIELVCALFDIESNRICVQT